MVEAGAMPPQVGVEPPEPPPPQPLAPPAMPAQPIEPGSRTPLVDIPRNLPSTYRSAATRATVAMVLVAIAVAAYAVQAVVQLSQLGILDAAAAGTLTTAEAEASDALVLGLGGIAAVIYVISAVAVLAWLWRAVDNVPTLTTRAFAWSRMAAVGWWFAPFANWVMPYRVVRDTLHELGSGASATIVTAWWVFHAGSTIASWLVRIGGRSSLDTIEELRSTVMLAGAIIGAQIVAGVLLIVVIRRLEGFARAWERGAMTPEASAPAWGHVGIESATSVNPHAPEAWPEVEGTAESLVTDPRTIESFVASTDGPLAPPSPPAMA